MQIKNLVIALTAILFAVEPAFAADAAEAATGLGALGAGLGIAIAALGGALGQGKATAAALDSIGRNPGASGQLFTPMIIGLVLIESLVIYALIVALKLVGMI